MESQWSILKVLVLNGTFLQRKICRYLVIPLEAGFTLLVYYGPFNGAVNSSDFRALTNQTISKYWTGRDMEGCDRGVI